MSKEKASNASLSEINSTVVVPDINETSFFRKFMAYSGPGALVAVGYMDPGNWITSILGGVRYKYLLLSVVLISIFIAMLMQYLSAKLGIVTQMDLAQATAKHVPRYVGYILWIIAELAMMATDIAEVIGSAIALHLLFNIPLLSGVLITAFDVMLLLALIRFGIRRVELLVWFLIFIVAGVFLYEVILAQPNIQAIFSNMIPHKSILLNQDKLLLSLGIIGATVMPHNLYLHSSLAQTRRFDHDDKEQVAEALRFSKWDSNIHLIGACIINMLLLILGAAMFYGKSNDLNAFSQLYHALENSSIVGSIASPLLATLFAIALLASGQNSTITGTLSGQIVMEGYTNLRLPLWARRLVTRILALIPIIIIVLIFGAKETILDDLIIYTQVFLSIALPLSLFPLIYFTASKKLMGERFVNRWYTTFIGYGLSAILTVLNIDLIYATIQQFAQMFQ